MFSGLGFASSPANGGCPFFCWGGGGGGTCFFFALRGTGDGKGASLFFTAEGMGGGTGGALKKPFSSPSDAALLFWGFCKWGGTGGGPFPMEYISV